MKGESQLVRDCTDNYWKWEEGRNSICRFVKKNQDSAHCYYSFVLKMFKKKMINGKMPYILFQQQHDEPLLHGCKFIFRCSTRASLGTLLT